MPYPKHPATIGEHILKRRHELDLFQKDVGQQLGVTNFTIMNWEKGYSAPEIRYYPAIQAFLEYDLFPEPATLGERIIAWRRQHGLSRKQLAKQLSVDEASLAKREKDAASKTEKKAKQLTDFLEEKFSYVSN